MLKNNYNYRDFVVSWCTAKSKEELVKELSLSFTTLNTRAKTLRKAGVNLPDLKLRGGGTLSDPLEIAQLNSLVKKYTKNS